MKKNVKNGAIILPRVIDSKKVASLDDASLFKAQNVAVSRANSLKKVNQEKSKLGTLTDGDIEKYKQIASITRDLILESKRREIIESDEYKNSLSGVHLEF